MIKESAEFKTFKNALGEYVAEVCSIVQKMQAYLTPFLKADYVEPNQITAHWKIKPDIKSHLNTVLLGIHFFQQQRPLDSSLKVLNAVEQSLSLKGKLSNPLEDTDWGILRNHFEMRLWQFIVEDYLDLCWLNHQAILWDENLFSEILNSLLEEIDDDHIESVTLLAPITWIKLADDPISLTDGVKLRKLTSSEIEDWLNGSWKFDGKKVYDHNVTWLNSAIEVTSKHGRNEVGLKNYGKRYVTEFQQSQKIKNVLGLLRIITDKDIKLAFVQRQTISLLERRFFIEDSPAPRTKDLLSSKEFFSPDQSSDLIRFWEELQNDTTSRKIGLAFRRWSGSSDRIDLEDRLIDYWIGLESLFAPDFGTELSFRASMRIAGFLGNDFEERARIYKEMRDSYEWRSTLVHGNSDAKKRNKLHNKVTLGKITDITGKYLQDTIVRLLKTGSALPISTETSELEILRKLNENGADN